MLVVFNVFFVVLSQLTVGGRIGCSGQSAPLHVAEVIRRGTDTVRLHHRQMEVQTVQEILRAWNDVMWRPARKYIRITNGSSYT